MRAWINRTLGALTSAITASPSTTPPSGNPLAALAIKSETTGYVYQSTRSSLELVQGTVAACLDARASERGVIRFTVKEDGKDTPLSKCIQNMLDHPNPVQGRTDFLETCSQFHDATGQAVLYFIEGDGGWPCEVWNLPSFYLVPIFQDPSNPIPSAYRWADGRVIADTHLVCLIRNNSLKTAPYTGRGFLNDHYDSALLYDLVCKSQKNWFWNGGAPNVAIMSKEGIAFTPEQIADVQKTWNSRYNPATGTTNVAVLPDGVTAKDFGPAELNFNASKSEIRDSIREAMQTPKIILGDTDNVNHNNGQTALAMFERLVVLRWGEKFASALEHHFKINYSKKLTVVLDEKVTQGFTQLPTQNGIVQMPATAEFPDPNNPNG